MTDRATTTTARREAWNRRRSAPAAPLPRDPLAFLEDQARKTRAAFSAATRRI
ncbi:MAG TPA: hypothetical protein VGU24_15195 [Microvirga sp.]|jgi:hypothetical protein|nr:hypothetical protein [Microvirga sp.]